LLQAQTVRMTPGSTSARMTAIVAAPGTSQLTAGSSGLGKLTLDAVDASLVTPMSAPSLLNVDSPVSRAATLTTSDLHGVKALTTQLSAPSAVKIPAAAAKADSNNAKTQPTALSSLQTATEPKAKQEPGQTKDLSAEALFDGTQAKPEPKEWTFMVFLNGHNNLDEFGAMNIKQMENVGSNDRVNIVVQWASLGKPTRRMLIQRSESGEVTSPVIESLPAVDMGDAAQLSEFIRWTVERFPAQRYLVDIWDHGAGWHLAPKRSISPLDISWDDQTGHHITTEQIGEVMRQAKALIGRPIDILGFDACLMAMGEVVAEVADSVRYVAGSEETEPGAGWPYDKTLRQWLSAPPDDGATLIKALTEQYVAAYRSGVTFSALDVQKFPAFVAAAKSLAQEISQLDAKGLAAVQAAAQDTQRYAYSDYGDFLDFVLRLVNAPVQVISAPVLDAAVTAFRAMVLASGASDDRSGSNGMSVWLPMESDLWQNYGERYLALVWHRLTQWGDAVRRLAGAS